MYSRSAFSLVELSIVLVILGLLTGGILAGQSLIHAAEVRAITTEYNRFHTAAQTFRDKYFQMPGDMNNATKFWGDNNSACPDGATPDGTPGVCNGNGDGTVGTSGLAGPGAPTEGLQIWTHLNYAGLLEGSYPGVGALSPPMSPLVRGVSIPASKYNGQVGWSILNSIGDRTDYTVGNDGFVGSGGVLAVDAWNIDTKMDDGKPGSGRVTSGMGACTTGTEYTLTGASSANCALNFRLN